MAIEDKVTKQSSIVIDSFKDLDIELQDEYSKLLKGYQKLNKKYNKMITLGDKYSSKVMDTNENLQDFTKKKVFESMASVRKIKEEHTKEITKYKAVIAKYEKIQKDIQPQNISKNNGRDKIFKNLLRQSIIKVSTTNDTLVCSVIGINNFKNIKIELNNFTNQEHFILGIEKYLHNSLKSTDTVSYFKDEMFYLIMPCRKIEDAKKLLNVICKNRTINKLDISLRSCITLFTKEDTAVSLLERCFLGYVTSIKDTASVVVV